MKITAIRVYQVDLPLKEGRYNWSGGNFMEVFDSTVVAVETDAGITGYAECCPLGSAYLPSYAKGVRAGLDEIGPKLIGHDPTDLWPLNHHMDAVLRGHPYVKAPIDIACWDILGKVAGLPVYKLLGGAEQDKIALYRAISQEDAARHGAEDRRLSRRGLHQIPAQGRRRRQSTTSPASRPAAPSSSRPTSSSPTPTPAGPRPTRRAW